MAEKSKKTKVVRVSSELCTLTFVDRQTGRALVEAMFLH